MKTVKIKRFAILDMAEGEYCIMFRDRAHFLKCVRDLAMQKYKFFQLDERGKAHPLTRINF